MLKSTTTQRQPATQVNDRRNGKAKIGRLEKINTEWKIKEIYDAIESHERYLIIH